MHLIWLMSTLALAGDLRLAVTEFTSAASDPDLAPLGKGLQSMFTTDLAFVPGVEVVERERLAEITAELSLTDKGLVDPATAARAGALLGASHLVSGSYTLVGEQLRLDARLFSVEDGQVVLAESRTGERELFFDLQKDLVGELVRGLAVEIPPKARVKIQRVHTADWEAFSAYSAGLAAIDDADYRAALAQLEQATTLDADFDLAAVTLEEAERLVVELQTRAEAMQAVEREQQRLETAEAEADNVRKAQVVVQRLLAHAGSTTAATRRERLTALWLLSRGYLGLQRTNAIAAISYTVDEYAMERMGEVFAARYLAEALEAWPAVPATLDTEVYPRFPLHDSFETDFAEAMASLHGDDDPEDHRRALRRGLVRTDWTARALHLDKAGELALLAELEPLGRTLPPDERSRFNREHLARAALRLLETDTALRLALELSQQSTTSADVRDMAELAEDARKVKAALATGPSPHLREYLLLALHNSKSLDWATSRGPEALGQQEPTEQGWEWLLDEREWGPSFKLVGDVPTWLVQGRSHAWTGPRSDPRRAEQLQWVATREDPEPALWMVGAQPVSSHAVTVKLRRSAPTDRPGPMPAGVPEVHWLFGLEDVDRDEEIIDGQRQLTHPSRGWRVRLGPDGLWLEQIEEAVRKSWRKDQWSVKRTLASVEGELPEDVDVQVSVKGKKVVVKAGELRLRASLEAPVEGFQGLWVDGTGFVEVALDGWRQP